MLANESAATGLYEQRRVWAHASATEPGCTSHRDCWFVAPYGRSTTDCCFASPRARRRSFAPPWNRPPERSEFVDAAVSADRSWVLLLARSSILDRWFGTDRRCRCWRDCSSEQRLVAVEPTAGAAATRLWGARFVVLSRWQ